jgi:hypothetical protein
VNNPLKNPASAATGARAYNVQSQPSDFTQASEPVQVLLQRLEGVKSTGKGEWSARCPAHADSNPSLSIAQGDDGRCLVNCHAGCDFGAIVAAVELSQRDLFPDRPGAGRRWRNKRPKEAIHGLPRRPQAKAPKGTPPVRRCETTPGEDQPGVLAEQLTRSKGKITVAWKYLDACGETCGYILRWDTPGGKDIRPVSRGLDGRWRVGAMPEPRPLYRLPAICDLGMDALVYVAEGEKAADALVQAGFEATTSSGGGMAPGKTNWTPLAGRKVAIWPDNDEAGFAYAKAVAEILIRLDPPATVRILAPVVLGMGEKEDAADFVNKGNTL